MYLKYLIVINVHYQYFGAKYLMLVAKLLPGIEEQRHSRPVLLLVDLLLL